MIGQVSSTPGFAKYRQVKDLLCKRIIETGARPGQKLWTEAELVGALDVSITTIRRALDELVREQVVVRRVGKGTFLKSMPGRTAPRGQTAMMLAHTSWAELNRDVYHGEIIRAIEAVLALSGRRLVVLANDWQRNPAEGIEDIRRHSPAGIILPFRSFSERPFISRLATLGVPMMLTGHPIPGFAGAQIYFDDHAGGAMAAAYLIERGHRRFGVIASREGSPPGEERVNGFTEVVRRTPGCELVACVVPSDYDEQAGHTQAARLIEGPVRPTAVFCAGDLLAYGAIKRFSEHGLRVPEDLAVMGYGGFKHASLFHPKLTTVGMDLGRLGAEAGQWLSSITKGTPLAPFERKLPVAIIAGDTA